MYKSNFNKNQYYSERAHKLIPGGAHTYSKGDDQFPTNAPKIIEKGYGCHLWDVDGNKYIDLIFLAAKSSPNSSTLTFNCVIYARTKRKEK